MFVTSDTHFFHRNILKYEYLARPFASQAELESGDVSWASVEAMNQEIIKNWNNVVGKDDDVYHLGDFAFALKFKRQDILQILERLNGRKHICLGNHDSPRFFKDPEVACHFESVTRESIPLHVEYGSYRFYMMHYAMLEWPHKDRGKSFNLYGHNHSNYPMYVPGFSMNMGLEHNNLTPFFIDDVVHRILEEREKLTTLPWRHDNHGKGSR